MKSKLRRFLIRIHFTALTVAILNGVIKGTTAYGLEGNIEFGVELLTMISGLGLFFFYLKPFRKISYYFSGYALVTSLVMLALIFRVIAMGLILSIVLLPVIPDHVQFEKDDVIIATAYQGFMAPCCTYRVKERLYTIFEKDYGLWDLEGEGPVDFESVVVVSDKNEIVISYSTRYEEEVVHEKRVIKKDE